MNTVLSVLYRYRYRMTEMASTEAYTLYVYVSLYCIIMVKKTGSESKCSKQMSHSGLFFEERKRNVADPDPSGRELFCRIRYLFTVKCVQKTGVSLNIGT